MSTKITFFVITLPWGGAGYSRISGFRFLSERDKNGVEMHFTVIFHFSDFTLQPCPVRAIPKAYYFLEK